MLCGPAATKALPLEKRNYRRGTGRFTDSKKKLRSLLHKKKVISVCRSVQVP